MKYYEKSVFEVCEMIHGSYCGSGDGLPLEKLIELRDWLLNRIETWKKPIDRTSSYDACVLNLLHVAVVEVSLDIFSSEKFDKISKINNALKLFFIDGFNLTVMSFNDPLAIIVFDELNVKNPASTNARFDVEKQCFIDFVPVTLSAEQRAKLARIILENSK